jgi:hypothetical protein
MRNERTTSRREFLTTSLVGAVGFNAVQNLYSLESARSIEQPAKSRVSIAYDSLLRGPLPDAHGTAAIRHDSKTLDSDRVSNLLDQAMQGLFDSADRGRIWEKLVRPGQLIGVKVNTLV